MGLFHTHIHLPPNKQTKWLPKARSTFPSSSAVTSTPVSRPPPAVSSSSSEASPSVRSRSSARRQCPRQVLLRLRLLHGQAEGGARAWCDHLLHHQGVLHRQLALHHHRRPRSPRFHQEHDLRRRSG